MAKGGSVRLLYTAISTAVLTTGIVSRVVETDSVLIGKYLGDALYAVMFYLCLAIAWPTQGVIQRALATTIFVIGIECFQLTGIPLAMRQSGNLVARVLSIALGTKFGWYDLVAYCLGVLGIVTVDRQILRNPTAHK